MRMCASQFSYSGSFSLSVCPSKVSRRNARLGVTCLIFSATASSEHQRTSTSYKTPQENEEDESDADFIPGYDDGEAEPSEEDTDFE